MTNEKIDLIFCDVQLQDGLSFSIFEKVDVTAPIIFVTGHQSFYLEAFRKNGIEYLLKPVDKEDLARAISKYKSLQLHFGSTRIKETGEENVSLFSQSGRKRIIAKKGSEHMSILLSDIVFFFTENKVTFAVLGNGKRFIVDKPIGVLANELDNKQFFRANRQYLLNVDFIKSYKTYEHVKLWIELTVNPFDSPIVVSQITAPVFRKWIEKV